MIKEEGRDGGERERKSERKGERGRRYKKGIGEYCGLKREKQADRKKKDKHRDIKAHT